MTDPYLAVDIQPSNNRLGHSQQGIELPPRVRLIIDEVCARHKVGIHDLLGPGRRRHITAARHEAMRRVRGEIIIQGLPVSYPMIGRWFRRDHSTCVYAVMGHGSR